MPTDFFEQGGMSGKLIGYIWSLAFILLMFTVFSVTQCEHHRIDANRSIGSATGRP